MDGKGILVGLTGQTGAGKTTVSGYIRERGYPVVDADLAAREAVSRGGGCLRELELAFGAGILRRDGSLNRERMGELVFSDKRLREEFNRIVFPHIVEEIFRRVEGLWQSGAGIVFVDAPTLIESGSHERCDLVVSVVAGESVRLERILARDGLTREKAEARMESQHPDEYYTSRSQHVIVNDGGLPSLLERTEEMLREVSLFARRRKAGEEART